MGPCQRVLQRIGGWYGKNSAPSNTVELVAAAFFLNFNCILVVASRVIVSLPTCCCLYPSPFTAINSGRTRKNNDLTWSASRGLRTRLLTWDEQSQLWIAEQKRCLVLDTATPRTVLESQMYAELEQFAKEQGLLTKGRCFFFCPPLC